MRVLLVSVCTVLVVPLVLGAAVVLLGGSGRTAASSSRIDYLARMEARVTPADPAQDAWPLWIEALTRLVSPEDLSMRSASPGAVEPGDEKWDEFVPFLESNRELLPLLVEAAGRQAWGAPYHPRRYHESRRDWCAKNGDTEGVAHWSGQLAAVPPGPIQAYSARIPNLLEVRALGNLLALAAREARSEGRREEALQYVLSIHGVGRQLGERMTLIEQAISNAMLWQAGEEFRRLLLGTTGEWTDDELVRLAGSPPCEHPIRGLRDASLGEWWWMLDVVQFVFGSSGRPRTGSWSTIASGYGSSSSGIADLIARLELSLHVDRGATERKLEDIRNVLVRELEAGRTPPPLEVAFPEVCGPLDQMRWALVHLLDQHSILEHTQQILEMAALERDANRITVALLRHRRVHGRFPETLDELVPELLPAVPIDPGSGSAFDYGLDPESGAPTLRAAERSEPLLPPARQG